MINHQKIIEAKDRTKALFNQIATLAHEVDTAEELILHSLKLICEKNQWPLAHAIIFQELNHSIKMSPSIVYSSEPQRFLNLIEQFHLQSNNALTEYHHQVIFEKKAQWIKDLQLYKNHPYYQLFLEKGIQHLILFPLLFSNRVVGIIEFYAHQPELAEEWISELMAQIGNQLGIIVELKASSEQLRKLSMAIEQNFTAIEITDANGVIEYVNPIYLQTTGYSVKEIIGKKPSIHKSGIHPPEFYAQLWQTITAGHRWQGEICNRRKDGSLFWEQVTISPVKNARDEIINYVAIKIDITSKRQYEEQLKKAKEEAEAANRAKSEFLANMSHE
ncbi:MAG: PAS domain S-box protein, partial [Bacteroidales bacterium]